MDVCLCLWLLVVFLGVGVQAQELQRESPLRLATSASGIATAASDLCFVNYKVPLKR